MDMDLDRWTKGKRGPRASLVKILFVTFVVAMFAYLYESLKLSAALRREKKMKAVYDAYVATSDAKFRALNQQVLSMENEITQYICPLHPTESDIIAKSTHHKKNKIFISYCYYSPHENRMGLCEDNLRFFLIMLQLEPVATADLTILLNNIGDGYLSTETLELLKLHNVKVVIAPNKQIDLFIHQEAVMNLEATYDYYVFMNCGVRGPYYIPENIIGKNSPDVLESKRSAIVGRIQTGIKNYPAWISPFIHQLNTLKHNQLVVASGCSVSCEQTPHLQSFFVVVNNLGLKFIQKNWAEPPTPLTKAENIVRSEIGMTADLLTNVCYTIDSLQPYIMKTKITSSSRWDMNSRKQDETYACHNPSVVAVPNGFQVIFRKYNRQNHPIYPSHIAELDESEDIMCKFIPESSPYRCNNRRKELAIAIDKVEREYILIHHHVESLH